MFTGVKFARTLCQSGRFDLGKFYRCLDLPERPELPERPPKYRKDQKNDREALIGDN